MHEYKKGSCFTSLDDIKDKKITVMGLGLNGGGEACVRFFLKHGAYVTVTDMKTREQLKETVFRLENDSSLDTSRLKYVLGEHKIEDFKDAFCVIKNPGVKYENNKYLEAAKNIETDISIFLNFTKSKVIAVTGSKGKSSTVSAIYYGLKEAGIKCFLGGNITVSPLSFLEETTEETPVILELSSWQLSDLRGRGLLKPVISVITKIVPDHQNWYSNMDDYILDKRLIYKNQDENDWAIFDYDSSDDESSPSDYESWGELFSSECKAKILRYSRKNQENLVKEGKFFGVWQEKSDSGIIGKAFIPGMKEPFTVMKNLLLPGLHIKENVLNAALVLLLLGVQKEKIPMIFSAWQGVSHRLQHFYSYNSIEFYNDSCATVPEAAFCASQAFGKPVIFISGGTDKGLSFDSLLRAFVSSEKNIFKPKALFLLAGTGTDKILPELKKNNVKFEGPFLSLEELIVSLKNYIDSEKISGESVVFSPGATSFGMFLNEFDRGNKFMDLVKRIFL